MLNKENYLRLFDAETTAYLEEVPYDIGRDRLYSVDDLLRGGDPATPDGLARCYDSRVFEYFDRVGRNPRPVEAWAQESHDCFITEALDRYLSGFRPRNIVGVMGGHALLRTDDFYHKIVYFAKKIPEKGYMVTTGGGPGAMEAGHLGAWLAGRTAAETAAVLTELEAAPGFRDPGWLTGALAVRDKYPQLRRRQSLAVPTWLYGHEPPNVFATESAKFFSNSVREDVLLTIAFGGIIFMPGSAGTFREIFQDMVQNHYLTWSYASPMIFVGREYWTRQVPMYPVVMQMLATHRFKNLLTALVDDVESIVDIISDFEEVNALIASKKQGANHLLKQLHDSYLNNNWN